MAKVFSPSKAGIRQAATMLKHGKCVAFPTETVYGLGADATKEEAVLSVFAHKGRPLTDPLIVHTPDVPSARDLLVLEGRGRDVFDALAVRFWPGPLTMVGKACSLIPAVVTARTGFVGVRVPRLGLAQALLRECGLPIAAPSANRFGHVSPTRAVHVHSDLGHCAIGILDGDGSLRERWEDGEEGEVEECCEVGIESTVLKIEQGEGDDVKVVVFRQGGVALDVIRDTVRHLDVEVVLFSGKSHTVIPHKSSASDISDPTPKDISSPSPKDISSPSPKDISSPSPKDTTTGDEAPGQAITHYAPDVDTILLSSSATTPDSELGDVSSCAIIDIASKLVRYRDSALAYTDLSPENDVAIAQRAVFASLRWAEAIPHVTQVILVDPFDAIPTEPREHLAALRDRLFRASSGRVAPLPSP